MSRSVDQWVGNTDDTAIPTRVRVRVFERYGGVCQLSGRKILPGMAWQVDHRIALVNGGPHSEANMQPVLVEAHREKTSDDLALKSKTARQRAKHLGIFPKSSARIASRGFAPTRQPLPTPGDPNAP